MRKKRAFTLIELLVVVAIIALLISILLPSLSRARELSKRLVCSANLKGIGTACKIYAADNYDQWPVVPFDESPDLDITYVGEIRENPARDPTLPREFISQTEDDEDDTGQGPTDHLSPTRCFWMFVRTGGVTVKQFICPSSDDIPDDTNEIDRYYDFKGLRYISYGYQVPFGPTDTRPSENSDMRMVLAADKGPFSAWASCTIGGETFPAGFEMDRDSSPNEWKVLNSPNHGGRGAGEGQNGLFADGHAEFLKKPIIGIDEDNIYTLMGGLDPEDRWIGLCPYSNGICDNCAFPGQQAFASGTVNALTDCLIYP